MEESEARSSDQNPLKDFKLSDLSQERIVDAIYKYKTLRVRVKLVRLAFYMVNTLVFLGLALSYYQRHGYSAPVWGYIVQWSGVAVFFFAAVGTMASMEKELE